MGISVSVNQRYNGQDIVNVLRYDGADAILSFAPEITDAIVQGYIDNVLNRLSPEWSVVSCTFYDTDAPAGAPGLEVFPTQGTQIGSNGSVGVANQTALLVSYVANGGPPFRGRVYCGGLGSDQLVSGGLWGQGTQNGFSALATEFLTLPGSGLVDIFQVLSSSGTPTVPEGTRAMITGFVIRAIPATQRRRRIGVGS